MSYGVRSLLVSQHLHISYSYFVLPQERAEVLDVFVLKE